MNISEFLEFLQELYDVYVEKDLDAFHYANFDKIDLRG